MATMPQRRPAFIKAFESLINQVDSVNLAISEPSVKSFFAPTTDSKTGKSVWITNHDNSLEDGSKFLRGNFNDGYTLVCDDDIEYPPDFVSRLMEKHKQYGGIVGVMGKILKPRPINSFYRDEIVNYRTFGDVDNDYKVEVIGTCGILYGPDISISENDMVCPNSDIVVSAICKRRNIPMTVIAHKKDWLKNLMPMIGNVPSIFGKYHNNDSRLTKFVNENL